MISKIGQAMPDYVLPQNDPRIEYSIAQPANAH
jgi:hypothetical protein